jgi:hypothetical protein
MVYAAGASFTSMGWTHTLRATDPTAMTRLLASALVLAAAAPLAAQQAAPRPPVVQPDVFVAPLEVRAGRVSVGAPRNVTQAPGYDNQPAFSADGRTLFYTATREDAQADIWRLDLAGGMRSRVTTTAPESEYSATRTPDGRALSVIRVERDSTQRLWRIPLDGGAEGVILRDIRPVGYHAWADDTTLVLFVLGQPNTLQIARTGSQRGDTIITSVGRSLHRVPFTGTVQVSFVHKRAPKDWWLSSVNVHSRGVGTLVRMPDGVEDYVWLDDGSALCGQGSRLLRWKPGSGTTWEEIADLSSAGVTNITRLAVSPANDRIAIVADGVRP